VKHIKPWVRPANYMGQTWKGWYMALGHHRESNSLDESNFQVFHDKLGNLPRVSVDDTINAGSYWHKRSFLDIDGIQVVRESHPLVGWVEWIAIHETNKRALELAEELMCKLDSYPTLDEEHWGMLETEEVDKYWKGMPLHERIQCCQDSSESIFAARRDWPTDKVFDALREVVA